MKSLTHELTARKKNSPLANLFVLFCLLLIVSITNLSAKDIDSQIEVKGILEKYARDYEQDVTFTKDVTFGVKVGESFWSVIAKAKRDNVPATVAVLEGMPTVPTYYFFTDLETLRKIDKGEINALTASAKAFETDFAPFDVDVMEGYQPDNNFMTDLLSVYFHFWTRGLPEVVPFGIDRTRMTHGAQAAIFLLPARFFAQPTLQ